MSTDALRAQIRATLKAKLAASTASASASPQHEAAMNTPHAGAAVVIPLRLGSAQDTVILTQFFQRLAASPALLKMADSGWLRFDLRVDATALVAAPNALSAAPGHAGPAASAMAATTTIDPAACCSSCKEGKACECKGDTCALHDHKAEFPELQGVIGEKLLKTLPASVKTVRIHPKAVLTPLGKETLRKRGITLERGATP